MLFELRPDSSSAKRSKIDPLRVQDRNFQKAIGAMLMKNPFLKVSTRTGLLMVGPFMHTLKYKWDVRDQRGQ